MSKEYLYKELPEFSAEDFDKIMNESPRHKVKDSFVSPEIEFIF